MCSSCKHDNRPAAKFCEECAAPLKRVCSGCGSDLSPTAKFCGECGAKDDAVAIRWPSGRTATFAFPKKGPIPHDFVHLAVEEGLALRRGFWGMAAEGIDPSHIQEIAKAAGHASAARAQIPDPEIVELLQAERIVECFEADLWDAPADGETFRSTV